MTTWKWQKAYQEAVLETDWTKMQERIRWAESEIVARRLELPQHHSGVDHDGTDKERQALLDAIHALKTLQRDVDSWLERQVSA
jgi:hypothetical protein